MKFGLKSYAPVVVLVPLEHLFLPLLSTYSNRMGTGISIEGYQIVWDHVTRGVNEISNIY